MTAVGGQTELGRLGRLASEAEEPPTPLERTMNELARATLVLAIAVSVLVPLIGVANGRPFREMLLSGLALAYATIPEELPILVQMLVGVGGQRLAKRHVLLRRTRAAEAVGGITVVLSDKTGTLTENRLRLQDVTGDRERLLESRPRGPWRRGFARPAGRSACASGRGPSAAGGRAGRTVPV